MDPFDVDYHGNVSRWRIADNGNYWTLIGGYYVRVFKKSLNNWSALFKPEGAKESDAPNWVKGTFISDTQAKLAALEELCVHLC